MKFEEWSLNQSLNGTDFGIKTNQLFSKSTASKNFCKNFCFQYELETWDNGNLVALNYNQNSIQN